MQVNNKIYIIPVVPSTNLPEPWKAKLVKSETRNFTDTKRGRSASSTPSRLRCFAGEVVGVLFPHLSNE